jgi:hypothetical protein
LAEIKGEIEVIWKFNGQLGAKLKKSNTKNQNKKALKSVADIEVLQGQNCIKLKGWSQSGCS